MTAGPARFDKQLVEALASDPIMQPYNVTSLPKFGDRGKPTEREVQVLLGVSAGMTVAQIGRTLHLAHDTVKTHLRRAYVKLGARNAAHAVMLAHVAGYLPMSCQGSEPTLAERSQMKVHAQRPMAAVRAQYIVDLVKHHPKQRPLPVDLAERYPSVKWGEREWFLALKHDQDLYNDIVAGIQRLTDVRGPLPRPRTD